MELVRGRWTIDSLIRTHSSMKYSVESAIADFDSMIQVITPQVPQKPQYIAVRSGLPDYLRYLEPLVTGRALCSAEELGYVLTRFVKETLGVEDDQISEKAIYFGVMGFSTLVVAKRRDNYSTIDFDELSELWFTQALFPVEALKKYGFFDLVNIKGLDLLLQGFLRLHVQPLVRSPQKMTEALSHFETQFFSGVLLGQIVTFLILRDHYAGAWLWSACSDRSAC